MIIGGKTTITKIWPRKSSQNYLMLCIFVKIEHTMKKKTLKLVSVKLRISFFQRVSFEVKIVEI